jgi:hypothetical protein
MIGRPPGQEADLLIGLPRRSAPLPDGVRARAPVPLSCLLRGPPMTPTTPTRFRPYGRIVDEASVRGKDPLGRRRWVQVVSVPARVGDASARVHDHLEGRKRGAPGQVTSR